MKRLLHLIAMTLGGWLGWALGSPAGTLVAFLASAVGTGAGLWLAIRLDREWL
jgi:hypothetical protein